MERAGVGTGASALTPTPPTPTGPTGGSLLFSLAVDAEPDGLLVTSNDPELSHLIVACEGAGTIFDYGVINTGETQIRSITSVGGSPSQLVESGYVWVTNESADTVTGLYVDLIPPLVTPPAPVPAGSSPDGIAAVISTVGRRLYVANENRDTLSVFDADVVPLVLVRTVPLAGGPDSVAARSTSSRATDRVFVALEVGGSVAVLDGEGAPVTSIPTGGNPDTVAYDAARERLYVAVQGLNQLAIYDTRTDTFASIGRVSVGATPEGIALDPASGFVYVANNGEGTVSVIDADASPASVVATVAVGPAPEGVAFCPNAHILFVGDNVDNTVRALEGFIH